MAKKLLGLYCKAVQRKCSTGTNWRVTSPPADRIRSVYSGLKQNQPGVENIETIECNGCRQDGNHAKARGFCLTVEVQEEGRGELLSTNLG